MAFPDSGINESCRSGIPLNRYACRTHREEVDMLASNEESEAVIARPHPLGIKPAGNVFITSKNIKLAAGLFAALPDEVTIHVLDYLDAVGLRRLGSTCKALYAYARLDDLWKTLCIESVPSTVAWRGSWRSTYLSLCSSHLFEIDCTGLYSDILHRPFFCAHTTLEPYCVNFSVRKAIPRLADLTPEHFTAAWTDKPFILSSPVKQWQLFRLWSTEYLLHKYGNLKFRAEAVDWPLSTYTHYMRHNEDESPLYLFDRSFVEKMSLLVGPGGDYTPPACFGVDLFDVLKHQRPDHRWLIIGPKRSGSTFHKDPNATSAWNAIIRGSKYWIMFPSGPNDPPPPGVYVSEDQSEVTSPLSIAEWLLGFHAQARRTPGCMEGVCREGEVLHVPSGWWHLVVNLEESIAITQNFVPEAHLGEVLDFLMNKPGQVSGFAKEIENPHALFVENMSEEYPELLEKGIDAMEKRHGGRKRKWEELVNGHNEHTKGVGAFSFGFGDEENEEVP